MSNGKSMYLVHPSHTVILRGTERKGGEKVEATAGEYAALEGKLLTEQEFEKVCAALHGAAEFARMLHEEKFQENVEAMRNGEPAPLPTNPETEE